MVVSPPLDFLRLRLEILCKGRPTWRIVRALGSAFLRHVGHEIAHDVVVPKVAREVLLGGDPRPELVQYFLVLAREEGLARSLSTFAFEEMSWQE